MTFKPLNYNLTLTPDFTKFTFQGKEIITFEISEHHHEIQLDCADITVKTCSLVYDQREHVASFKENVHDETLHIEFKSELPAGKYQLKIEYRGILNDQLKGFYRSKYVYKGKENYVLTTQFEPTEAHRAFPCIDNPSSKATFDVSFIIPKEYTGISNMLPKEEKDISEALKLVRFETTPVMSPYLLYFGIGKWDLIERRSKNNVLIRGITTPEKSKYTEFSLEVAEKCLDYFAEYFDYPYILPKLDLLAIPDFASGAMENWGAVTFREILLLYYHGKTSKAIRERIAEVICHELAHQWFGNLVTMKWFDDIWLNESFATYMAFKALHHIFPQWDNWQNYVTDTVFEGMALDSLHSTHPIHVHGVQVKDIDELFDEISYDKGGSVLRMIEGYLGGEKFQKAIRNYIRMFQYQNTVARDLWDRFEEASGDLTAEMIEKFVMQPGFPLVTVRFENNHLQLQQERFLFLGTDKGKLTWDVPLVLQHKNHDSKKLILTTKQTEVKLSQNDIITLNKNYTGFYISDYISSHFSYNSPQGKVGMIHDFYYLVLADKQNLDTFLDFIQKYALQDTDPYVSQYVAGKLLRIFKLTRNEKAKNMLRSVSQKIIQRLGLQPQPEEKLSHSTARNTAITGLVLLGDIEISHFVQKLFRNSLKDETTLHKDLKGVIYASAVWIDDKNYSVIHDLYRKKEIQEEKIKLLSALGNAQDQKRVEQTLQYILTDEVRLSDYFYPITTASVNPKAQEAAYNWLINKWERILQKLGLVTAIYMRKTLKFIVPECAIGKEQEINLFLQEHKIAGLDKTYAQALEELEVNTRFVRRYRQSK
jgi:tricorn protease interacting factor F2/3